MKNENRKQKIEIYKNKLIRANCKKQVERLKNNNVQKEHRLCKVKEDGGFSS